MDCWTEIKFVQVAETGSLSRAAEALDLSNAAASRHLSALEKRLGARLVKRNTRRIYFTATGKVVAGVAGVAHPVNAPPPSAARMAAALCLRFTLSSMRPPFSPSLRTWRPCGKTDTGNLFFR